MKHALFVLGLVAAFTALILLNFVCFGAGLVTDSAKGVAQRTLDADNVLYNYEYFYDVNAAYEARLAQVGDYQTYYDEEADPQEKARLRTELSAMRQTCRNLSTEYNANSQKRNRSFFRDNRLPDSLSVEACG